MNDLIRLLGKLNRDYGEAVSLTSRLLKLSESLEVGEQAAELNRLVEARGQALLRAQAGLDQLNKSGGGSLIWLESLNPEERKHAESLLDSARDRAVQARQSGEELARLLGRETDQLLRQRVDLDKGEKLMRAYKGFASPVPLCFDRRA